MIVWYTRVTYALCVALGLILVFLVTDGMYKSEETAQYEAIAFESKEFDRFIAARYYSPDFIVLSQTIDDISIDFYIYEVASTSKDQISLHGLVIFMHQLNGTPLENGFTLRLYTDQEEYIDVECIKWRDLALYVTYDTENSSNSIKYDLFKDVNSILGLEIIQNESTVLELNQLNIEINELNLDQKLLEYYSVEEVFPNEDVEGISRVRQRFLTTNIMVWVYMSLYSLFFIFATLIYYYIQNRKKMGNKELTPGLEKDIARLNKKD